MPKVELETGNIPDLQVPLDDPGDSVQKIVKPENIIQVP